MQRTQVAIIGAGPTGLMLGALLFKAGIHSVILERCSDEQILERNWSGILEPSSIELIAASGVPTRLKQEGVDQQGFWIGVHGRRHRVDLKALTGHTVVSYGQSDLTADLMGARAAAGLLTHYSVEQLSIQELDGRHPTLRYQKQGQSCELQCEFVAGCDGFHGVSRASIPSRAYRTFERMYPFGWLGILADAAPVQDELVYAHHARGFAMCSMRGRKQLRCFLQCNLSDKLTQWTDELVWGELRQRLDPETAAQLQPGPILERSIAPVRSFVAEPLRHGRMFLAGDAAHVVPLTSPKGLNLALSDVSLLSQALVRYFRHHDEQGLDSYSEQVLQQVWRAQRFSWHLTRLLHSFPDQHGFDQRIQQAELEHLTRSATAQAALAESYVTL
ncbi:MAG: 4-hydroxybenzoate 3-monooxygenase [Burkholderiaceae bacterium]|nr:4-hydroxybenzoate 3-monooxygenase [Roseateles sp.]MBV8470343.1 4-hydroxybenzoate 3-monooxygenase [Burkholderiaceae bacterium]